MESRSASSGLQVTSRGTWGYRVAAMTESGVVLHLLLEVDPQIQPVPWPRIAVAEMRTSRLGQLALNRRPLRRSLYLPNRTWNPCP
jgi:hypothetical protein